MPRLAPLPPPYPASVAEDLAKLMPPGMEPLGLFKTLAHNPRVLGRVRRGGLLDPGTTSLRQRELVILRTTALCGAEYEWGVHVAFFAAMAELSDAEVAATISGRLEGFAEADRALLEAGEALHRSASIDDALWKRLATHLAPAQLIEVLMLAGQYHAISYLTNGLQLDLEPKAPRFSR